MKKLLLLSAFLIIGAVAANSAGAFADAPAVGADAPEFSLTTNEGNNAGLKDFRGQWVVLYFYPKDATPGCTLEAHNFQADLDKYKAMKTVILGVSVDTSESHKSFCAKEGLTFKLLSDPGGKISDTYGSVMEHEGAKYSARNTFIIDPQGKVAKVFMGVKPSGHSAEVLAALETLQKESATN
ncbi:MAG: alkyl hydroperoxide reductase/Thiol specific antioxidant/Mal allergen [Acidobacteria bacterium]|nr:alkyl hydroperoxide reductase/Thiol specific antioxidant/Mal allergen [Acidobacteriota bacterium]